MAATDNAAEQVAHIAEKIRAGKTTLGIEFGSTRIKAVLIDDNFQTIASGDYSWASHLEDGLWSYTTEEIWGGLQSAYAIMPNSSDIPKRVTMLRASLVACSISLAAPVVISPKMSSSAARPPQ